MKSNVKFCIFLQFAWIVEGFFDLDELKSFNYGIDIRNEPVVMTSQEEGGTNINTIQLTSKFGQPYRCSFPNTVENEKQKEEAEKVAMETGIPDLLKPMESSPCMRKTMDWWSYEFCYGKHIKQFHISEDGIIQGDIILLGYYESEFNWDDSDDKGEHEKKQSRLRRYHTQQYVNGSKCDLSGKNRRTEVRFMCEEGSADYIARLDEPETCVYIMTIHTMKICHHPFLKPPTPTQTVTITCNPLLTVNQYQEYLDQLEAKEAQERLEEEKRKEEKLKEEEEERQMKEEKAKYLEENQIPLEEMGTGNIEGVDSSVVEDADEDSLFQSDWSTLARNARNADGSPVEMKTMFKVVESPEDLKDFLKDTIREMKKLHTQSSKKMGIKEEEKEEEEGGEKKINIPPVPSHGSKSTLKPLYSDDDDDAATDHLDDPELEELETEIKTLKERYKNRRDRLTNIKNRVKSSMEAQYASIIKEAQDELARDGLETDAEIQENRDAIRQLTKTIDGLLSKLDKTEKEIAAVDKELEQFAEYDSEEKDVKSIPPVKDDSPATSVKGPAKTDNDDDDTRVKVRVSRIKKGDKTLFGNEVKNKQTEELERSVQKELEKAGLTSGDKIQVKIITTGFIDDEDNVHVLSEQESETFRNLIVDMIGGHSEVDREQAKHDQQEENYSFVWGKDSTSYPQTPAVGQTGHQVDSHPHGTLEANTETQTTVLTESQSLTGSDVTGSDDVLIEDEEES